MTFQSLLPITNKFELDQIATITNRNQTNWITLFLILKFVVQDINALIMRPIWPKYIKPLVKVMTHPSQYYFGQNGVNFKVLCVK